MGAVEDAVARLTAQIPSRTVYPYAVPDGTLPGHYLIVSGSVGASEARRLTGTVNMRIPSIWVRSVSRNPDPQAAVREADWGAEQARNALENFSPDGTWPFRSEASAPASTNDVTASTSAVATEQFSRRTYL